MTDQIQFTGTREEFLAKAREMMTEEDIERAAKAIYETDDVWSASFPFDAKADYDKNTYRILARAAFDAALQTPHEANPK